jgi:hypothetical protein
MDRGKRAPTKKKLEPLLYFIAIQWTRVPAFRPVVLDLCDKISYERMNEMLERRLALLMQSVLGSLSISPKALERTIVQECCIHQRNNLTCLG